VSGLMWRFSRSHHLSLSVRTTARPHQVSCRD